MGSDDYNPQQFLPLTPANKNKKLNWISAHKTLGPMGITDRLIKLNIKVNNGAKIKSIIFDRLGITISLIINFKPSANGCKRPQKPTTLGPFLL